ncbi:MAG: hypothetical protein HYV63_30090 [Candidatus Schekmanbacteria bacterium]|nr:hypothetical protein [Candidatus Schekmanbacteria bacterium]
MPAPVVVPTETFHTSLATAETASAAPPPLLAPEQTEAAMSTANALRVVVRMIDLDGQPLADATFCVFKPGVAPLPGQIRRQDVLLLRRTNSGGLFDSDQIGTRLAPGIYRVKAVHHDYASFETEMLLSEGSTPGIGVLTFRLAPENQ